MSFTQLHYYICVIKSGSITQAAKQLYISQQALSKHILMLEKELGVALLERTVLGVKPTQYGEIVYRCAQAALNQIQAMENELALVKQRAQSIVRLGIQAGSYSIYSALPTNVLMEFSEANPDIELQTIVFEAFRTDYGQIFNDGFDLIYTVEPSSVEQIAPRRLLTKEPVYILMSAEHHLAGKACIYQADLKKEHFLLPYAHASHENIFNSAFSSLANIPDKYYDANSINEVIERIRLNKGLFFAGKAYLLSLNLDTLVVRPFADCGYHIEHVIYYQPDSPAEGPTMKAADWLCAHCKRLG